MEPIKIHISGAEAMVIRAPTLTAGMTNVPVVFSFDASWDGMKRNAVYRAGGVQEMDIDIDFISTVSPAVMQQVGYELEVGIYGTKEDGTVLPTVWAVAGRILEGTDDTAQQMIKPQAPLWQQALDKLNRVDEQIRDALQEAKDSGEFDGPPGEPGKDGYTPKKGIDYWTDADKAEIKAYVDEAILGGAW